MKCFVYLNLYIKRFYQEINISKCIVILLFLLFHVFDNVMDKIWYRKSFEVGGHWPLWRDEKNE